MKRAFFVGLLVFSLLVNASVGVVIARHWWHEKKYNAIESTECPALSREDLQKISKNWSGETKMGIMKTRRELQSKRAEVLDLIASNPGNLKPAQSAIHELINLRAVLESQILERISQTMASLPHEKRMAFLEFLKHKTCRMKGSGRGIGPGGGRGCGPPGEGPCKEPGM
jgi:hypothetical protein